MGNYDNMTKQDFQKINAKRYQNQGNGTSIVKHNRLVGFDDKKYGKFMFQGTRLEDSRNPVSAARRMAYEISNNYHLPSKEYKNMAKVVNTDTLKQPMSRQEQQRLFNAQSYEDSHKGLILTDNKGRLAAFHDYENGVLNMQIPAYQNNVNPVGQARSDIYNHIEPEGLRTLNKNIYSNYMPMKDSGKFGIHVANVNKSNRPLSEYERNMREPTKPEDKVKLANVADKLNEIRHEQELKNGTPEEQIINRMEQRNPKSDVAKSRKIFEAKLPGMLQNKLGVSSNRKLTKHDLPSKFQQMPNQKPKQKSAPQKDAGDDLEL